jgi:hypothetical protein
VEGDEIVDGMRLDEELVGGAQQHGGPEIGEREGHGAPEMDIAGVPQQPHSGVSPVLDRHLRHLRHRHLLHLHLQNLLRIKKPDCTKSSSEAFRFYLQFSDLKKNVRSDRIGSDRIGSDQMECACAVPVPVLTQSPAQINPMARRLGLSIL